MTPILDIAEFQQALDALIIGDQSAAVTWFSDDLVLSGVGGCLDGRTTSLSAVLDRFADISQLTHGTFGTEVEAVYGDTSAQLVVITRHWASMNGDPIHGTQALVVTVAGGRVSTIHALSRGGSATGIWD